MKIIISPAKIQNGNGYVDFPTFPIIYKEKTQDLISTLQTYSKPSLGKLMKIKNKLLDTTYDVIQNRTNTKASILLYNGIVYKEINAQLYDQIQLEYMHTHLRILSGLYGVLEPFTEIYPYRLDMTMKPDGINLYKYWSKEINEHFKDELIVNLASKEFSQLINKEMVNVYFKEEQSDGTLKIITVRAKKARGLMVDYMINNMIDNPLELKGFNEMGYNYNESLSDEWNYTFVLPYE